MIHYIDFNSFMAQLLQFVNPSVKYNCGGKRISGVAIILKDLLSVYTYTLIVFAEKRDCNRHCVHANCSHGRW